MSIKEKENKTPVLNIHFSIKGEILAISYGVFFNKILLETKKVI